LWARACSRKRYFRRSGLWMCRRLRWQASSHRSFVVLQVCERRRTLWERACSRKRCVRCKNCGCADAFAGKPAPTGPLSCSKFVSAAENVGAGLLAKALCQAQRLWMCRRLRWQASSHRSFVVLQVCERRQNCGSELARESAVSGAVDCGCADAFAGKPAPTGISPCSKSVSTAETCGSGLAREGAVSGAAIVDVPAPSLAGQLPQVFRHPRNL